MTTCKQIADVLDAAYDLMDEVGWTQGEAALAPEEDGPLCVGHAIIRCTPAGVGRKAYDAFARWIGDTVPHWNDRHRELEVIGALEQCSDFYRSRGAQPLTLQMGRHGAR